MRAFISADCYSEVSTIVAVARHPGADGAKAPRSAARNVRVGQLDPGTREMARERAALAFLALNLEAGVMPL
jgi:hypothetical protein